MIEVCEALLMIVERSETGMIEVCEALLMIVFLP